LGAIQSFSNEQAKILFKNGENIPDSDLNEIYKNIGIEKVSAVPFDIWELLLRSARLNESIKKQSFYKNLDLFICSEIWLFNQKGEPEKPDNKKKPKRSLMDFCMQIASAVINNLEKRRERPTSPRKLLSLSPYAEYALYSDIIIPMLVFGNEVDFIVTLPELLEKGCAGTKVEGIIYLFNPLSNKYTYLMPLLITSYQHLPSILDRINATAIKFRKLMYT